MTPRERKEKMYAADSSCFVCRQVIDSVEEATLEHIIPRSKGGPNSMANLALSHKACNQRKGSDMVMDHSPEEYLRLLRTLKTIIKGKDELIVTLSEALKIKKSNLQRVSIENEFMRKRIKECFGVEGYLRVMAHVECPGGFDTENFKKVHAL